MKRLLKPLWVVLAVLFLIEAWLWEKLEPVVERVVARIPLERMKVATVQLVERLPPWLVVFVFAIPALLLFPFKLMGLWLIAHHHPLPGVFTFLLAKMVGLGVTAFLFETCRGKLLQLGWFALVYRYVLWVRDWARVQVAPVRARISELREQLRAWLWQGENSGRYGRLVRILRRRAKTARAGRDQDAH